MAANLDAMFALFHISLHPRSSGYVHFLKHLFING